MTAARLSPLATDCGVGGEDESDFSDAEAYVRSLEVSDTLNDGQTVSDAIVSLACVDYAKLTRATAQRTLRFMQVREAVT